MDFHDDPVEEFFYQLKGDMILKIADGPGLGGAEVKTPAPCVLIRWYDQRHLEDRSALELDGVPMEPRVAG